MLPAVSPGLKMNMRHFLESARSAGSAIEVIGNRMEPNRLSIRLFVNVVRSPYGNAEVTEVQVQV